MFILNVCDKAIYDRMNKGPKHKESKPCASLFMEVADVWQRVKMPPSGRADEEKRFGIRR